MLKRNLIAIAIITLGLGITSAFGQFSDTTQGVKSPRKTTTKQKRSETNAIDNNENARKSTLGNNQGNQPKGWVDGSFDIAGRVTSAQTNFQDGDDIILRRSAKSKSSSSSGTRKKAQVVNRKPQGKAVFEDMMEGSGIRRKQPRKRN